MPSLKDAMLVVALIAVSALGVARLQPRLARIAHDVKRGEDVYVLPPPAEFKIVDVGYDAAAIDLLWAKLLVDYGIHLAEKREFHPDPYLDTITFVEPTYKPVYHFADTLLCFRSPRGTADDARKAREVLERGLQALPHDHEVWFQYGQFVAFLGPSFLGDAVEERERWRHDGALAIMRAVELGADPDRAISAATILSSSEERDATIAALGRAYAAAVDDPETQRQIGLKLDRLNASAQKETFARQVQAVDSRWHETYPFLPRGVFVLLGPAIEPARCVGPASADDPACARDWDDIVRQAARR